MRSLLFASTLMAASCNPETNINVLYPVIAVSPDFYDFEEVVVDFTATTTIELLNAGRATLLVTAIEWEDGNPDGVFTADPPAFEIGFTEEDDSAELTVTCTPGTYLQYNDTMVLYTNDDANPEVRIPIACLGGDGPTPDIDMDSLSLDFGDVYPGTTGYISTELRNVGDGDLTIDSTQLTDSGDFQLVIDPAGNTMGPGNNFALVLTYTPPLPQSPDEEIGDHGSLIITSNDPDEPVVTVNILGNGGGDFEYPVALIDGPSDVSPPDTILLNGSRSFDPNNLALVDYRWSLSRQPEGSQSQLEDTEGQTAELFVDVAGDYEVQLQVMNEGDVLSAPAKYNLTAIPLDDIHVELTWSTGAADMDLHMFNGDQYELFQIPGDVCYCNPTPEWGDSSSTDDDPRLDLDDLAGYGPENINIATPANGTYPVRVHYFDDQGDGAVTATVKFYLMGELTDTWSRVLDRGQMWEVGTIRWPDAVVVEEDNPPVVAPARSCYSP